MHLRQSLFSAFERATDPTNKSSGLACPSHTRLRADCGHSLHIGHLRGEPALLRGARHPAIVRQHRPIVGGHEHSPLHQQVVGGAGAGDSAGAVRALCAAGVHTLQIGQMRQQPVCLSDLLQRMDPGRGPRVRQRQRVIGDEQHRAGDV